MIYHWFQNDVSNVSISKMQNLVTYLDDCGYYSVLFPYYSLMSDPFIKSAAAIKKDEKIKFMVALRPRALSPEYCAMMCSAFGLIQRDRLMLNIVHGHLAPEEVQDAIIDPTNAFDSRESTLQYTETFLEKLIEKTNFKNLGVDLVMSGGKSETMKISKKYADYSVVGYDNFTDNPDRYSNVEPSKVMVGIRIVIRDSDEECKEYKDKYLNEENLLVSTKGQLLNRIAELESLGVRDMIISSHDPDQEARRVHDFVKLQNSNIDFIA
jgi:alkanesulfonate monooxygenase SsuD/methylene tetrahydromethanopterin reductase-like flavin-dependent oxidoreductase (luciferase family)